VAARAKLHQLKEMYYEFWKELTTRRPEDCVPDENVLQPEDSLVEDADDLLDDSDIPIRIAIEAIVENKGCIDGYKVVDGGTLVADTLAEMFEEEEAVKPINVTVLYLVFEGPVTKPEKDHKKTRPQPHWTKNRMDRSRPQPQSGPWSFLIF
jgi:hypothetical protein